MMVARYADKEGGEADLCRVGLSDTRELRRVRNVSGLLN